MQRKVVKKVDPDPWGLQRIVENNQKLAMENPERMAALPQWLQERVQEEFKARVVDMVASPVNMVAGETLRSEPVRVQNDDVEMVDDADKKTRKKVDAQKVQGVMREVVTIKVLRMTRTQRRNQRKKNVKMRRAEGCQASC